MGLETLVKGEETVEGLHWSESWIHGELIGELIHDDAEKRISSKMPTKLRKKVSMGDETTMPS